MLESCESFHRVQLYPREVETLLLVKEGFV